MDEILRNPLNFGADGVVKDSVIENLGLTCPNMCGGISRGKCVKSNQQKLLLNEPWRCRINFFK